MAEEEDKSSLFVKLMRNAKFVDAAIGFFKHLDFLSDEIRRCHARVSHLENELKCSSEAEEYNQAKTLCHFAESLGFDEDKVNEIYQLLKKGK